MTLDRKLTQANSNKTFKLENNWKYARKIKITKVFSQKYKGKNLAFMWNPGLSQSVKATLNSVIAHPTRLACLPKQNELKSSCHGYQLDEPPGGNGEPRRKTMHCLQRSSTNSPGSWSREIDEEPKTVNPLAKDRGCALQLVLEMVSRKEHKIPGIHT